MNFGELFAKAKYVLSGEDYHFPYVRRLFKIDNPVKQAKLIISALGFCEIEINGKRVHDDLYVTPFSNFNKLHRKNRNVEFRHYTFFDEKVSYTIYASVYDVTEFLNAGENCLGVILSGGWYRCGSDKWGNYQNYGSTKVCFRLQIEYKNGTKAEIVSDENCKWKESFLLYGGIYHEEQDETKEIIDFSLPTYDDSDWKNVATEEAPKAEYLLKDFPSQKIIRKVKPRLIQSGLGYQIYDVGENITGFPIISSSYACKDRITCYYSEEKTDENLLDPLHQYDQFTKFFTDGRIKHRLRFTWHGFRYFKIESEKNDAGIYCDEVAVVHDDIKNTSEFSCGDSVLDWLYDAYVRSQLENFQCGIPTDCPQIERKGYTGDGQLLCEAGMMMFDSRKLYKKWLRDIADTQDQISGHVQYTAPTIVGCGGGPGGWGCAIVVVPYEYYKAYGDEEILNEFYSKALRYLDYLEEHSKNGLIYSDEPFCWCLGDWCTPVHVQIPVPFVNTCFYAYALTLLQKIARIIGKDEDVDKFKKKYGELKKVIYDAYFDEITGDFCRNLQGANAFALKVGFGDERTVRNMKINYAKTGSLDTGIFGTDFVTEMLLQNGEADLVYDLLTSEGQCSFKRWKDEGATTLRENWQNARSHNHPMFGAVVKYFFRYILGIRQKEESAAYERIIIHPLRFKNLKNASGKIQTEKGAISVKYTDNQVGRFFEIVIPEGVQAEFVFEGYYKLLNVGLNKITVRNRKMAI